MPMAAQRLVFALFCFSLVPPAIAQGGQATLVLQNEQKHYSVQPYAHYLKAPRKQKHLSQVAQSPDFRSLPPGGLNLGITQDIVWLKFKIDGRHLHSGHWLMAIEYPLLDHVTLFLLNNKRGVIKKELGDEVGFAHRALKHRYPVFVLPELKGRQYTVYLRFDTRGTMRMPVHIYQSERFLEKSHQHHYFLGAVIGFLILMLILNLFLAVSTKEISYFLFSLLIISYTLFASLQHGVLFQWLEPENLAWKMGLYALSATFGIIFGALFTASFLQTRRHSRLAHALLQATIAVSSLQILAVFLLPDQLFLLATSILGILWALVNLLVSSITLYKGFSPAKMFVLAWIFYVLGIAIFAARGIGLLPNNNYTLYASEIGFFFMAIFISFALVYRIRVLDKERAQAQRQSLKRMQEINNLRSANIEEMKRNEQLKDEFIMNTSYELREPLNQIIGLASSLIKKREDPADANERADLNLILMSAQRLFDMINDILDLAQLQNNKINLSKQFCNIVDIVNIVINQKERELSAKPVQLINKINSQLPMVYGDEARLQQVFSQLLDNAIKFTDHGKITIWGELAQQGQEKSFFVHIQDEGIGIPQDKEKQIFEPYYQNAQNQKSQLQGTGVGLTIAQKIINLHGGRLSVTSKLDQGSTFTIQLPIHQSSQVAPSSQAALPSNESSHHPQKDITLESSARPELSSQNHVAVIDDDIINLRLVETYLQEYSFEVSPFTDANSIFDYLELFGPPRVILIDIYMPGLNGFEITRRIRAKYSRMELPILLIAQKTNNADLIQGLRFGANDYLTKPLAKEELLNRVETLANLQGIQEQKELLKDYDRELKLANQIQTKSLPPKTPKVDKLAIAARYLPMALVGGDFYHFHELDQDKVGIFISDVSGHGISAALITSMVKLSCLVLKDLAESPAMFLGEMNRLLYDNTESHFLTAAYMVVDSARQSITYAQAGHIPLIINNRQGHQIREYKPKGSLMGIKTTLNSEEIQIPLHQGDRIILYTDGITELWDQSNQEMFGEKSFYEFIYASEGVNHLNFAANLENKLNEWHGEGSYDDDITYVVIDHG